MRLWPRPDGHGDPEREQLSDTLDVVWEPLDRGTRKSHCRNVHSVSVLAQTAESRRQSAGDEAKCHRCSGQGGPRPWTARKQMLTEALRDRRVAVSAALSRAVGLGRLGIWTPCPLACPQTDRIPRAPRAVAAPSLPFEGPPRIFSGLSTPPSPSPTRSKAEMAVRPLEKRSEPPTRA